jgi:23S rRNA-/tRNA-specific pseudouridylate synthase
MGFPILGDKHYCNEESLRLSEKLGICVQQLQSARPVFTHPFTADKNGLTAPQLEIFLSIM